jgi:capsular polysaccharide export protein
MIEGSRRFFLFPLQLDSDAQIRVHSPFGRMRPAIETVIRSFAAQAPMDTQLVISEHPLDQAVVDLQPIVMQCAESLGVTRRIVYLHGGTPPPLLAACLGMVTVNSTMGLSALELGRPVAVLGQSVYRIPGLVHAGALDDFWTDARPPDVGLFQAFKHFLIQSTQLPGGYYGPVARRLAIAGAVRRLQAAREAAKDPDCIAAPAMNAMNPVVAITEGRAAFR